MTNSKQNFHLGLHSVSSSQSSGSISSQNHRHYKAHSHVDTPAPILEPSTSKSSASSADSTGSYMDAHQQHHHSHHSIQHFVQQLPDPIAITSHTIQDHITELHYGHVARSAKKEARRSSSQSTHAWKQNPVLTKSDSIPEYVEEVEDWKERDAELWAKEVEKREKARRMTGDLS